ncbi:DUF4142 domain-containing protein [Bdellovibrio sp. NC01]|uniref:DUF4142 domain-containing protein n=1 Tax=Bdellovibrio sp. NC01 TaxID=2220073 RepID=UPI001157C104|nr:DUF4142 domain-containing protein [Bdellovibrio sp. NC01]QDK37267.1 hypothetical protein DOE51_06520 [Bdellovibrio sp. NC01]
MNFKKLFLSSALLSMLVGPAALALSDSEIAEIMKTANQAEIDAGKMAKSKASNSEVKDFAKHMVSAHESNMKDGKKVAKKEKIKPENNDTAKDLKKSAKDQMAELKTKKGSEFDKAYIDNQVAMHQQLLNDLDSKFIPQASNAEFKSFLEETRTHVQEHLSKAQQIQSSMASSAPAPGQPSTK